KLVRGVEVVPNDVLVPVARGAIKANAEVGPVAIIARTIAIIETTAIVEVLVMPRVVVIPAALVAKVVEVVIVAAIVASVRNRPGWNSMPGLCPRLTAWRILPARFVSPAVRIRFSTSPAL
ncbi:MAG: hypothetical protein ACPGVU_26865, partial [Limisphaerales bacterium]